MTLALGGRDVARVAAAAGAAGLRADLTEHRAAPRTPGANGMRSAGARWEKTC